MKLFNLFDIQKALLKKLLTPVEGLKVGVSFLINEVIFCKPLDMIKKSDLQVLLLQVSQTSGLDQWTPDLQAKK